MHTKEFEKWWDELKGHGLVEAAWLHLNEAALKRLAWATWKTGREKLHEELTPQLLQRAS